MHTQADLFRPAHDAAHLLRTVIRAACQGDTIAFELHPTQWISPDKLAGCCPENFHKFHTPSYMPRMGYGMTHSAHTLMFPKLVVIALF